MLSDWSWQQRETTDSQSSLDALGWCHHSDALDSSRNHAGKDSIPRRQFAVGVYELVLDGAKGEEAHASLARGARVKTT